MRRDYHQMHHVGASLALVSQGTPVESAAFARDMELPFPVLADPNRVAFAAYGLADGGPTAFGHPTAVLRAARALVTGVGIGRPIGSTRQLPGTFVIDRGGMVRFAKPAIHAADTPTTEDLLQAVQSAMITVG